MRPEMGARTLVYSRFSSAARRLASYWCSEARRARRRDGIVDVLLADGLVLGQLR
jgi:hypothetical protein